MGAGLLQDARHGGVFRHKDLQVADQQPVGRRLHAEPAVDRNPLARHGANVDRPALFARQPDHKAGAAQAAVGVAIGPRLQPERFARSYLLPSRQGRVEIPRSICRAFGVALAVRGGVPLGGGGADESEGQGKHDGRFHAATHVRSSGG